MEILHNGFTLEICPGGFPLSTDSIALSGFVSLPRKARVLDLGSGCGTLGVLLCARDPGCHVTGIELDPNAHETALQNSLVNGLTSRLTSICEDIRSVPGILKPGTFSVCVSNPPYYSGGPQSQKTPLARREDACSLEDLFRTASWALQYGGDFYLVHKPERLAEICTWGSANSLDPKRLLLLRHKEGGPVSLILIQCRKGGKPGLLWEEAALHDRDGIPTEYYRNLYHLGG